MRDAQLQPFYGGLGEATSVGRSLYGSTNFVQFTTSCLVPSDGDYFNHYKESLMTNLTIFSKSIRHTDNLYSLNDLHKASGNAPKHQPNRFIRLEQTQELIDEINRYPDLGIAKNSIRGGKNQGTWVCKELVYAYAMWISPKFSLMVIRAFDAMQNVQPHPIQKSKHGFSRMISVYRNNMLIDSYPLKIDDGIVSFREPEILKEMIRDTFPQYVLVKKSNILKALDLL